MPEERVSSKVQSSGANALNLSGTSACNPVARGPAALVEVSHLIHLHSIMLASALLMTIPVGSGAATSEAVETTTTVRKIRDVVLFQDPQFHCAFPSVVSLPGGELLCAFRRAPSRRTLWQLYDRHIDANSYLVAVRSGNGGETWTSQPETLYAHPFGGSQDPCLLSLHNKRLICASYGWASVPPPRVPDLQDQVFFADGFGFLGGYLLFSPDNGHSWEGPFYPPAVTGNVSQSALGGELPAYNRGAMVQNQDGDIFWAVARHDSLKPYRTSVHLMRSEDNGTSWSYQSEIASSPRHSFNEASLVLASNGDLIAFLRAEMDGGRVATARSRDGGKSFDTWQDAGFHGLPSQAINLPGEKLLLVYGYRRKPFGVRAKVISEDLSDLRTAPEIVLRDDGDTVDLGYPWAVQTGEDRVLVVYYINTGGTPPHIAGTLLEIGSSS